MLQLEHLAQLLEQHREVAAAPVAEFDIGGRHFAFNSAPAVMGVINLSADSWYRESVCLSTASALQRGRILQAQGADLVDVGAESTLANTLRTDPRKQRHLLVPLIRELRAAGILVSVETYLPEVARTCLEAGANVLNLTGATDSEEVFKMAADHGAAVILCLVQGQNVREVADLDLGRDPVGAMQDYFAHRLDIATNCGVERIFLDPGLGFYYRNLQDGEARVRHQMEVFLNSFRLRSLGHPICHALPHAFDFFKEEVRSAEPFFAVLAALGKTNLFRTHEVAKTKAVLDTLQVFGAEPDP